MNFNKCNLLNSYNLNKSKEMFSPFSQKNYEVLEVSWRSSKCPPEALSSWEPVQMEQIPRSPVISFLANTMAASWTDVYLGWSLLFRFCGSFTWILLVNHYFYYFIKGISLITLHYHIPNLVSQLGEFVCSPVSWRNLVILKGFRVIKDNLETCKCVLWCILGSQPHNSSSHSLFLLSLLYDVRGFSKLQKSILQAWYPYHDHRGWNWI